MVQVMVANVRCEEIMSERLKQMKSDEVWLALAQEAGTQLMTDFGPQASALLRTCLSGHHPLLVLLREGGFHLVGEQKALSFWHERGHVSIWV